MSEPDPASAPVAKRDGARVILLDPDGRVLLITERIESGTHSLTPGGGVEAGENLARAAARELFEETSLRVEIEAREEPVLVRERYWQWRGACYDQTDHFFVVRLADRPTLAPGAPTAMELETFIAYRWWSADELRAATDEVIEPPDLADLLDRLLRASAPPR